MDRLNTDEVNIDKLMVKLANEISNTPYNYPGDDEDAMIDASFILDELSDSGESEFGELVFRVNRDQIQAFSKVDGSRQFSIDLE